jgi:hypothetical protein
MTNVTADRHPEPDDLQRCVDDEIDPARDASLIAHVESCATCRSEIEQMRRVTALLSLSSTPPADLLARIKARRDSGERVLLPPVSSVEEQPAAVHMPAAAPAPAVGRRSRSNRRSWRWVAGPLGVAAMLLLAVRLMVQEERLDDRPAPVSASAPATRAESPAPGPTSEQPRRAPARSTPPEAGASARTRDRMRGAPVITDSSTSTESAPAESVSAARPDSARGLGGAEAGPLVSLHETQRALVIRLAASSTGIDDRQAQALDSAVSALQQHPERQAIIRYVDPSFNRESASWQLATRVSDHVTLGGVDPARVRLVRVQAVNKAGLPSQLDAVEVVVEQP